MANRKISELQSRTPALSDLMLVGDPSSGYSYKCTITALATIIETDIADGYVTIGTTQTISGAKTFSNNLTLTSVPSSAIDTDKFLVLNSNVVNYRTGAEVLSDIGGQGALTLTTTGTSGAATLVGNTLNIPQYQSVLTNPVTGTGTTNYVTKWTSSSAVGNSQIIDNGTAIGIGTAPSNAYLLSVAGIYRGIATGDGARIELIDSQSGGATFFISPQQSLGVTSLGTYGAYPISFVTNNTERARLLSGGNFGINTTTPNEKLEVSGVVRVSRTTSASAYLNLTIESGVAGFDARGSIDQVFYTNALERVRIGFGGEVTLSSIANATTDTDKFLVSDSGVIKYRTGSEVLSDIGGASSSSISGTTNYIPKFTSSSAIGNSIMYEGTNAIGIGTSNPASYTGFTNLVINNTSGGNIDLNVNGTRTFALTSTATENYVAGITNIPLLFLTNNTERLRISSTGNVSIGNTNNTYKLDVTGTGNFTDKLTAAGITSNEFLRVNRDGSNTLGSGAFMALYNTAFTSAIFQQLNASNGLDWWTTSAKLMTLDASGNLGLGVSPSAWGGNARVLQGANGGALTFNTAAPETAITSNAYYNGSNWIYATSDEASRYSVNGYNGSHTWDVAASGTAGNAISFTQAMTLFSTGNLAVGGTSDNGSRLRITAATNEWGIDLQGSTTTSQSYGALLRAGTNSSDRSFQITNAASSSTYFLVQGDGNVGISTTSPTSLLHLKSSAAGGQNLKIETTVAAGRNYIQFVNGSGDMGYMGYGGADSKFYIINQLNDDMLFYTNSSERMRITSGGNVLVNNTTDRGYKFQANSNSSTGAAEIRQNNAAGDIALTITNEATSGTRQMVSFQSGGYGVVGSITSDNTSTAFNTSSDYRLKQDLKIFNGLSLIDSIKVYDYQWKADNTRSYGVLAHELQQIIPYAVTGEKDGTLIQGVDYSKLVPVLVQAIKELKAEIETLKYK